MGWKWRFGLVMFSFLIGLFFFGLSTSNLQAAVVEERGCLEITKEWVFPEGFDDLFPDFDYETSIDVVVTGPDGYDETWVLEADGWKEMRCELVPGRYSIAEVTVDGYETIYPNGQTVEVVGGGEEEKVTIKIKNTLELGCLEVTKLFEKPDVIAEPASIEINITGPGGYDEDFILGADGWTKTICELLPGYYTVTEKHITGWTTSYDPEDRTVDVVAGNDAEPVKIEITNIFDLYCLKIIKIFAGDFDDSILPDYIEVTIKGLSADLSFPETGATIILEKTKGYEWEDCKIIPGEYQISKEPLSGWQLEIHPEDGIVYVGVKDKHPAIRLALWARFLILNRMLLLQTPI